MEPRSSSRWPARKSTHHKSEDEDKKEPAFICTICWRPQHTPSKPKLLGSSARIVCKPCWKAVLDLSICWVCGEYIVRGDEVVSLGWCFWHKACFGCLVCGTRISVPSVEGGDREKKGVLGVELEEIPLCEVCKVEMSGESPGMVRERGVENVTKFDGGLSRERLQKWSEVSNEDEEDTQSRSLVVHRDGVMRSGKPCSRSSMVSNTRNLRSLLHSAMDTRILGDGSADEPRGLPGREEDSSNAYVSVFNPIGGPAFEPSKTKPLPKWMNLLPNNAHRDREQKGKDIDIQSSGDTLKLKQDALIPLPKPENDHLEDQGYVTPTKVAWSHADLQTPPMDILNAHPRIRSKIVFAPYAEFESTERGQRDGRRSHTLESTYMTPPEYPRQTTPFPRRVRPSFSRHGPSSYFVHRPSESTIKEPWERNICCELASPLQVPTPMPEPTSPEQVASPPTRQLLVPSQSSEYLEKYRPKSAATNHERYVAKDPEPVLNKLKRQRIGSQKLEQVAEQRMMKRRVGERARSPRWPDEEFGLDPRRKDLNRELRNLFCEE